MTFNPAKQLNTTTDSVGELLNRSYFEIPSNQRQYSWGEDQVKKMWLDLTTTVSHDFIDNSHSQLGHFLGAIVVIGHDRAHEEDRWQVIDGQQRLTTLTILAEVLRSSLDQVDLEPRSRRSFDQRLSSCVSSPMGRMQPRLILNRENDFYQASINNHVTREEKENFWAKSWNKSSEVQSNIVHAFRAFYELLDLYINEMQDDPEAFGNLVSSLTENFYVLVARTERIDMAYRLFETLNERGLDLSQADLIRNTLIESASLYGESAANELSIVWSSMLDNYEDQARKRIDLPQLIQFSYSSRHQKVEKERIFEQIWEDLKTGHYRPLELAREFHRDSALWKDFLLGDLANWSQELADQQYAIIDPLWKAHSVPFILAAMERFSSDISSLERCFQSLEHFLFREGVVKKSLVSRLQQVFSESSHLIRAGGSIEDLSSHLRKESPDATFVEEFSSFSVTNMKQAFYAMWKIEGYLSNGLEFRPCSQSAAQHVEHIMPRNPGPEWNDIQKDPDFKPFLNRLGNLMVLPSKVNGTIRNRGIDHKIRNEHNLDYLSSRMMLAEQFVENFDSWSMKGRWTFESISLRQEFLAKNYALKVWAI